MGRMWVLLYFPKGDVSGKLKRKFRVRGKFPESPRGPLDLQRPITIISFFGPFLSGIFPFWDVCFLFSPSFFFFLLFFSFPKVTKTMLVLSEAECEFIQGGIDQNVRADGRGNLNSRSLVLESGVVTQVRALNPIKI